jgi:hypothetical protein
MKPMTIFSMGDWRSPASANFIAKVNIGGGHGEKADGEPNEQEIVHGRRILPFPSRA